MKPITFSERQAIAAAYKRMTKPETVAKKAPVVDKKNQRNEVKPVPSRMPKGVKVPKAKEVTKSTIRPTPRCAFKFNEAVDNPNDVEEILRGDVEGRSTEGDAEAVLDVETKTDIKARADELDGFLSDFIYGDDDMAHDFDFRDVETHADEIYNEWKRLVDEEDIGEKEAARAAVEAVLSSDQEGNEAEEGIFNDTEEESINMKDKKDGKRIMECFGNFKSWCANRKPLQLVAEAEAEDDGIEAVEDRLSVYDQQAEDFCKETETEVKIVKVGRGKNRDWDDEKERDKYRVTLKNPKGVFTFTFWNSFDATEKGKTPSKYDVLAAIASDISAYNSSRDLEDFAHMFGYEMNDKKSHRKAEKIFDAVKDAFDKASAIYDEEQLGKLYAIESCVSECGDSTEKVDEAAVDGNLRTFYNNDPLQYTYEQYLEFCKDNDIEPPPEDDSQEFHDWVNEELSIDSDDFFANVESSKTCDGKWLAFATYYNNHYNGTFGRPSGDYHNYVAYGDGFKEVFDELVANCRGCRDIAVFGDGKKVYVRLGHHDGVETYTLVKLNDRGVKAFEEYKEWEDGYTDDKPAVDVDALDSDEYIVPVDHLF